ncbi:hypothetical protein K2Q00_02320 [Patescibacteria group bacterium]|nr:hypothetical protein [Patescibacteria group bacterium]
MKFHYSAVLITATLLIAPTAFAQEDRGNTPPPRPQPKNIQLFIRHEGSDNMRREEGSTTIEHRPMMRANIGSTTNPGIGWGDDRRDERREMMASSSERFGTSTPPKVVIREKIKHMLSFFNKDEKRSSTSTPPREDTESSSTTPQKPPQAAIQFLQNFFGRFFH